ncbi:hypothetical protein [Streptomyces sp. GMY02]|uniref:hypothetical protein n=1 Tax=Streptomyces sp. GMY02 TaxID=1333528 RepID=UPI0018EFDD48|nr:hypothetical protein [Streptomyces sp. GMY02]
MPDAVAEDDVARAATAATAEDSALPAGPAPGSGPGPAGFEQLSAVADAVLYEGYLLYPYRRSSPKNRVRWQFGVLLPRDWVERDGPVAVGVSGSADSWYQQTECLLRMRRPDAAVRVRVRYLQTQHKQVEAAGPDGGHRPVPSLRADDGTAWLTFDEAVPRETDLAVALADLLDGREHTASVGAPGGEATEPLPSGAGRVVRRREEVRARTTLTAVRLADDLVRLRVRTENTGRSADPGAPREEALRRALIATHTLVGGDGVEFVSLIDPPGELARPAGECRSEFTFPVLGGAPLAQTDGTQPYGGREASGGSTGPLLLSAPIILPDRPQIAPESPGDLHDAGEIDEILTLRTMLLTDEEKAEARATDPRAAEIIDRVDSMPPEVFARLHGAIRSLSPAGSPAPAGPSTPAGPPTPAEPPTSGGPFTPGGPFTFDGPFASDGPFAPGGSSGGERPAWWQEGGDEGLSPTTDTVLVDGVRVGGGSRVLLRPRGRGADAQDMFLAGRAARVAAVFHDVDGSTHLAVTLEDDPAAELHTWYGRFHYFRPEELEPLTAAEGPETPAPPGPPGAHAAPEPPEAPAPAP